MASRSDHQIEAYFPAAANVRRAHGFSSEISALVIRLPVSPGADGIEIPQGLLGALRQVFPTSPQLATIFIDHFGRDPRTMAPQLPTPACVVYGEPVYLVAPESLIEVGTFDVSSDMIAFIGCDVSSLAEATAGATSTTPSNLHRFFRTQSAKSLMGMLADATPRTGPVAFYDGSYVNVLGLELHILDLLAALIGSRVRRCD